MIYVGSLTVPQHNLWADLLVKYQKEHYPDMHEVTRRMPVAEVWMTHVKLPGPDENLS